MNSDIIKNLTYSFLIILCLFIIHIYNINNPDLLLYRYGIYPREYNGLKGILFSPLLHNINDIHHIVNNSSALFVLIFFLLIKYKKYFFIVTFFVWLFTGVFVWLFARTSYHIGASSLIYGFVFFIFFTGVFSKNRQNLALSIIVAFLYGSMIWGIFPQKDYTISYEGHFFGALSGIILAIILYHNYIPKYNSLYIRNEFRHYVDNYNKQRLEQQEFMDLFKNEKKDNLNDFLKK